MQLRSNGNKIPSISAAMSSQTRENEEEMNANEKETTKLLRRVKFLG